MTKPEKARRVSMERVYLPRRLGRVDRAKVTRFRRALRNGETLLPVDVMSIGGRYEVQDGFHRHHANRLEGRKTIKINIIAG